MPLLTTIVGYVSLKLIDQFIKEEGYGRIKKFFFPKRKYAEQLALIINNTIAEHEKTFPYKTDNNKFPFYHSQVLFEELSKHILFETYYYSHDELLKKVKENTNIIIPTQKELDSFYSLFVDKINESKKLKELFAEENYKEKIFEISESLKNIGKKLSTIEERITTLSKTLVFQPDSDWFRKQCQRSIIDLGNRYTPELNFELEISKIFDGLGRTIDFKNRITKQFDEFIIKGRKISKAPDEAKNLSQDLDFLFEKLLNLFLSIDFCNNQSIPLVELSERLNGIFEVSNKLETFYREEERKIQKEKDSYHYFHKYGHEINNIRDFHYELTKVNRLLNSDDFLLANNPFLLLDGEAGIGKSHMIGDVVTKRIDQGYESVFILGQHLVTDEDPWVQIFKKLQISSKPESFLHSLNERAKQNGKRIIVFIDAINEGRGKYFWGNNIKSFIRDFKTFDWLGLVLTIRTSYKDLLFPKSEISNLKIIEHTSYGFKNTEYEASKLFFKNYNIDLPNVPLLHPEFQNPLFLKLFCEGISKSGLTKIPDGLQGITSIINFFIKNVNGILSKPNRFDYSSGMNLVSRCIDAIIQYKIEKESRYIDYETASELVEDVVSKFVTKRGLFLEELISEGIFAKNLFWESETQNQEGIYLAYERFEDHLTAQYLLERFPNLEEELKEGGKFFEYVKDEYALFRNKGLIDAFSIQIPEKFGKEFYDFVPHFKSRYPIVESFVESLLWRKIETITEESRKYVKQYVFSDQEAYNLFWETRLSVTAIPGHLFNAYSLHSSLMKLSLPERDTGWTQDLSYKYSNDSSVKRLIDWAWSENDKMHISDESVKLSSITLAWFHTSTNRRLRDCATKALISLLHDRIAVLIEVLKLFEKVNDPYVYERLFAVAYGCAVRTKQKEKLKDLSEYIFHQIFETEEVYPHILLRDYAREVIEYTNYLGIELSFDITKVRPPYRSNWPENIPSINDLKQSYDKDQYWHLWESVMGFGDFARYIIGTNHNMSEWSGNRKGEKVIDRETLYEEFQANLSNTQLELFNELDPILSEDGDELIFGENKMKIRVATGRKPEEEIETAKEKFKNSLNSEQLKQYEEEIEPHIDHNHKLINTGKRFDLRVAQRIIFSRVIELGWNPKMHLSFDKGIGTGRGRDTYPHERIGKKYQWIAYHEYMAKLSDHFVKTERWGSRHEEDPYQGPWNPYVRDIDPTLLIDKTGGDDTEESSQCWWVSKHIPNWQCSNENWLETSDDLPASSTLINVKDLNNEEWLILEGHPSWSEPKKIGEEKWNHPRKELWYQIRSYIVKQSDSERLEDWTSAQDFMGRWMPESRDRYEIFSREYYWSPAYKDLMEKNEANDWTKIENGKTNELVGEVLVTTESFLWEEEFDKSKEHAIRFLKPCNQIYTQMNLSYSRREGEFLNNKNEMICFASNVYYDSKSYLLIKKMPFLKFLHENKLSIIWTILGEKQILGQNYRGDRVFRRLEISGSCYFEKSELKEIINTKRGG